MRNIPAFVGDLNQPYTREKGRFWRFFGTRTGLA